MSRFVAFVCERFSLAIVAIGGVFMVLVFVTVEANTTRLGSYGIVFRGNTNVVDVRIPQGALQSGDRIDLASLTPEQRFSLLAAPGNAHLTVRAMRGNATFPVTLSAAPPEYSRRAELTLDIGIPICFFLSLGLASALFLMRPKAATLAFYFYAILMLLKVYETPLDLAAWPLNLSSALLLQLVYPLAQLAILFFAQRLYGRSGRTWPWIVWPAIAAAATAFLIWADPILWVTTQKFGIPGPATRVLMAGSDIELLTIVLLGLAYIASGAEGLERRRVTWIVAGIALSPLLDLTWAIADVASTLAGDSSTMLLAVQAWTNALGPWFGLCGIVAVLYGFLSQHVVDLRMAIGRAALYGATTVVLVALFGAIEWLAEFLFESTRPAVYVSLVAALVIGFAIRALDGRFETFLEGIFFRDQRRAEASLRRAARALANTTSETALVTFLVDEPAAVLDLSSAALFLERNEGERFERIAARNWREEDAKAFEAGDPLVITLQAEREPVRLDARMRAMLRLPGESRIESLLVPLVMRAKVFGFVFYGERNDGAAFTESERDLLASLATNAAAAYDHIDANRSRERIRELEALLKPAAPKVPTG